MTIILLTAIITILLSVFLHQYIRKFDYYIYGVTVIIALLSLSEEANIVTLGYVPLGMFLVVMISGAMDKSFIRKRLFMVRRELAIIASILLFPHAFGFLEYYLEDLGLDEGSLSFFLGVIAAFIVIPLFITSFKFVRRKMNYKQWKNLHKLSYVFYLLVGLHLILIQNERMVMYIILFATYFAIKLYNLLISYFKTNKKNV
jgi:DMSO/TMAO reductase YedYZ heme-binding membrane subunit